MSERNKNQPNSEVCQLHSHGNKRLHNKEKKKKNVFYMETDQFFSTDTPYTSPMAIVN